MQVELDRGDVRILDVLQQHGDLSAADVAERVGMTPSTCWRPPYRIWSSGDVAPEHAESVESLCRTSAPPMRPTACYARCRGARGKAEKPSLPTSR